MGCGVSRPLVVGEGDDAASPATSPRGGGALHAAVRAAAQDADAAWCRIEQLLAGGAAVDARDARGRTPLHVAAELDHDWIAEQLLAGGACAAAADAAGRTPLHAAAVGGAAAAARALLAERAGAAAVDARDAAGATPLALAAAALAGARGDAGLAAAVSELLLVPSAPVGSRGADVNARAGAGTVLHVLAAAGLDEQIQLALSRPATLAPPPDLLARDEVTGATSLAAAAAAGHLSVVRALVAASRDTPALLAAGDRAGRRALEVAAPAVASWLSSAALLSAAAAGDLAGVRVALAAGADPATPCVDGSSAVHLSASGGHADALDALLAAAARAGAPPGAPPPAAEEQDLNGQAPLHAAAAAGHPATVQALLASGVSVHALNAIRGSALHVAAGEGGAGALAVCELLLAHGAELNARDQVENTPLHVAAAHGRADVLRRLLDSGADPAARNAERDSPLDVARRRGGRAGAEAAAALLAHALAAAAAADDAAAVRAAVAAGADPTGGGGGADAPLHVAAREARLDALRALLEAGARADALDVAGESPLHAAARAGSRRAVSLLLRAPGAAVDAVSGEGDAALHIAARGGAASVITALVVEGGAAIDTRHGATGGTPLHEAACCGDPAAAAELLRLGADPNAAAQPGGDTPAHLVAVWGGASGSGAVAVLEALHAAGARLRARNDRGETPRQLAEKLAARRGGPADSRGVAAALRRLEAMELTSPSLGSARSSASARAMAAARAAADAAAVPAGARAQPLDAELFGGPAAPPALPAPPAPPPPPPSALGAVLATAAAAAAAAPPEPIRVLARVAQAAPPVVRSPFDAGPAAATPPSPFASTASPFALRPAPATPPRAPPAPPAAAGFASASSSASAAPSAASSLAPRASAAPSAAAILEDLHIAWADLKLLRQVDRGSFGVVYEGVWQFQPVAVKILKSLPAAAAAAPGASSLEALEREVVVMAGLRHRNLARILGVAACGPPRPPGEVAIVSEWYERSGLNLVLRAARRDPAAAAELTWARRLRIARDVAAGMGALHKARPAPIVHRDLKSANVFLDENYRAVVGDFGLTRRSAGGDVAAAASSAGRNQNPLWLAPEVLQEAGGYSTQSDVYAFGIVMWELLTWQLPFSRPGARLNHWEVVRALATGGRPEVPPRGELPGPGAAAFAGLDEYEALMRRCWAQAPEERPPFDEVAGALVALLEAHAGASASEKRPGAGAGVTRLEELAPARPAPPPLATPTATPAATPAATAPRASEPAEVDRSPPPPPLPRASAPEPARGPNHDHDYDSIAAADDTLIPPPPGGDLVAAWLNGAVR